MEVVIKAQDERDLMRDDKVREQQRAERYRRDRAKLKRRNKALEAKLEGRLAGQESPEDDGKQDVAHQLMLMRREVEEERAARRAAEEEVVRLKNERESNSNRVGCEESKGSDEETAGLRHQVSQSIDSTAIRHCTSFFDWMESHSPLPVHVCDWCSLLFFSCCGSPHHCRSCSSARRR